MCLDLSSVQARGSCKIAAWQADLEAIRSALLQSRGGLVNMTGDERTLQAVQPLIGSFLDALPAQSVTHEAAWAASLPRLNEAITVPTQVRAPVQVLHHMHFLKLRVRMQITTIIPSWLKGKAV